MPYTSLLPFNIINFLNLNAHFLLTVIFPPPDPINEVDLQLFKNKNFKF